MEKEQVCLQEQRENFNILFDSRVRQISDMLSEVSDDIDPESVDGVTKEYMRSILKLSDEVINRFSLGKDPSANLAVGFRQKVGRGNYQIGNDNKEDQLDLKGFYEAVYEMLPGVIDEDAKNWFIENDKDGLVAQYTLRTLAENKPTPLLSNLIANANSYSQI